MMLRKASIAIRDSLFVLPVLLILLAGGMAGVLRLRGARRKKTG